jgi:CubicO group peptidase (beta-lactamase class C family)
VFYEGLGFGLGFSVVIDQAKTRVACPNGTYGWGGMASTAFWVDPVEEISAMFFTQLIPSTTHPIRPYLRSLVYQSIVE